MTLPGLLIDVGYIAASILFILGIKMLSKPDTARRGNLVSAAGMLIAVVITLFSGGLSFHWIIAGLIIGSLIGAVSARLVKMTAMPEMVALFNGFGGIASLLVGWAEYHARPDLPTFTAVAVFLAVLIGGVAFSGSMIAFAKLAEKISGKPVLYRGQQIVNALIVLGLIAAGAIWMNDPAGEYGNLIFIGIVLLSLILGVLGVIPIGGGDMPVVISLLNSYSGLAACAAGFIILNNVLIVSGALVGASGFILTNIMCKAMNRSLANVLFSGFGSAAPSGGGRAVQGEARPVSAEDAYYILEAAGSVAIVPGYGMAVAQAQHAVRELGEILEKNGAEVRYVIHPVAGRMPGHMNVLLAEANVPYDQLAEMDDVNPIINTVDVCLVIGANDVVNPDARENPDSPIYGMPIINVDFSKTTIVMKRSLNVGFAGIENPLFFKENTRMLFGDAKASLSALIAEFKES
ncbi:MAG TPA: NAD(P)(+) transhydrogenase (Re/Si-specific) subunit beta, partial [bacterium]|nr:NAD(P)(+) transhydrogenase (Re/Si-specific) subunit beta [bacterium]